MQGHLRRSRVEKVLNVVQRLRFRLFLSCGLASDPPPSPHYLYLLTRITRFYDKKTVQDF
jgi:hypothetical protein